jgi:hypothetical protein
MWSTSTIQSAEDLLVARIGRLERGVDFVGPAEDVQEVLRDKRRAMWRTTDGSWPKTGYRNREVSGRT